MLSLTNAFAVAFRQYLVWRAYWLNFIFVFVADPLVFLYALGFGLGMAFETMGGVPYLHFIMPGMLASTVMYSVTVDTTYGTLARFNEMGLWHAMLATPVRLEEILLGEALWSATRSTVAAVLVLLVSWALGAVPSFGFALMTLPFLWIFGLVLAGIGQAISSQATHMQSFDFIWPLYLSAMLLFGGIFIDRALFPEWVQWLTFIFPVTHTIEIIRPLTLGDFMPADVLLHAAYLLLLWFGSYKLAICLFKRRFFK